MDIYETWNPIIDMIRPKEEKFQNKVRYDKLNFILNDNIKSPCGIEEEEEKFRMFMCEYADKHRQREKKEEEKRPVFVAPPGWIPPEGAIGGDDDSFEHNTLPPSLKILSRINIVGKNIQLKDNLPIKTFSMKFDLKWVEEYKHRTGKDWIRKIEGELVDYLSDTINFQLGYENKNNLYVDLIISKVELKDDGLYLYSKYEIE